MAQTHPWTYTSITEALHHRTIILRVHTSSSPLLNGFEARNPAFRGLNLEQYHLATAPLRTTRWAEGPYMRDVIIDHLNNTTRKPSLHIGRLGRGNFQLRTGGGDDLTPWISTTANLDWALWYIFKLLAIGEQGRREIKMAIISITTDRTSNKELYVAPFLFRPPSETRGLSRVDRERYDRAKKNATMAKEVLFYGKIFRESILADLTFTTEELPFELPSVYYNPPNMLNPHFRGSWMGRLRWDPRLLNYEMAHYNRMRMLGMRCIWIGQPVDSRLQEINPALKTQVNGDQTTLGEYEERRQIQMTAPSRGESGIIKHREADHKPKSNSEGDVDIRSCNVEVLEAELVDLSI